jgi:hypothetical protein
MAAKTPPTVGERRIAPTRSNGFSLYVVKMSRKIDKNIDLARSNLWR